MGCSDGDCDGWTFAYNGNHRGPYKCYLKVGLPPQSDWQTDPNVISGWSATPEITTELLAAEVVNTTTAGFTTGGLAETRDLQQQQKSSGNRCCGQAPGGVPGSCGAPDWCSNPLNAWCSESQDHCEKHCDGLFCPDEAATPALRGAGASRAAVTPPVGPC